MDVIPIDTFVALTNSEIYAIREIIDKVVCSPIDPVLRRMQRMIGIGRIAMSIFTSGFIWFSYPPDFHTGAFGFPIQRPTIRSLTSVHSDSFMDVISKDPISIYCQSIITRFDAINLHMAVGIEVAPVLICRCVEYVVLVVVPWGREDGNGITGIVGKRDLSFPRASTGRWDVAGDVV